MCPSLCLSVQTTGVGGGGREAILLKLWPQIPNHMLTSPATHQGLTPQEALWSWPPTQHLHTCSSCPPSSPTPSLPSAPSLVLRLQWGHWSRTPGQQTPFSASRAWITSQQCLPEATSRGHFQRPPKHLNTTRSPLPNPPTLGPVPFLP